MQLTRSQKAALDALCDTFVPALRPSGDEDPVLFAASARDLDVTTRVIEALATIDSAKSKAFLFFLRLLENPLFVGALTGSFARFSDLPLSTREMLLRRLAESSLPPLRTAFQGARSLAMLHAYAANGSVQSDRVLGAIGYAPRINRAVSAPRLPVLRTNPSERLECDVCVIGSGAAGSVVAAELAAGGQSVIVAEGGSISSGSDFDQRELAGMRGLFREGGASGTRDLSMTLFAGACIGGGTTVNWQSCFPTPDDVRSQWARLSGCDHFAAASFTASLETVWKRIGASTAESRINPSNDAIRRGAQALGYRWSVIARNSRGCDLEQCGNCMFGCRVGGKQSAANTYLTDAIRSGTRVVHFTARRLKMKGTTVTGVEGFARDTSGTAFPMEILARRVVLAAGALETPAILMRSGLKSANLGRHLYLHPTVALAATYATTIESWHGPPQTVVCDEFSNLSNGYGYRIEAVPAHPGLLSVGLPWMSARAHRREMQQIRRAAPSIILARDSGSGRVRLSGEGEAYFEYRLGREDERLVKHGLASAARIHCAAGAERIMTLHTSPLLWERPLRGGSIEEFCQRIDAAPASPNRLPLFSAHQMGTCRMGANRSTAVCDASGAVFDLDGAYVADASLFPTSSGVNPMITIMALAHHVARAMLGRPT